jgi:tetratricopeptide (TPR) repeat protein
VHNYKELEKRWRTYRLKKYAKLYLLPMSVVVVGIASYFIFLYYTHPVTHSKQEVASIESKIKNAKQEMVVVERNATKNEIASTNEEQNKTIKQEPKEIVLSEMVDDEIRAPVSVKNKNCYEVIVDALNVREAPTTSSDVIDKYYRGDIVCENERAGDWLLADFGWIYARGFVSPLGQNREFDIEVDEQIGIIDALSEDNQKSEDKNTLSLESKKIDIDAKIQSLTKRYNSTPSYDIALDVARLYYSSKDYTEATKWALIANEHDSKKEDSWIVFANSLNALGKKDEAVKILKTYISNNPSAKKAKLALEGMER